MSETGCRADVWLWRARFFKTRSLAAKFLDEGKVRLTRSGAETRIDKCARPVKVGDHLVFAVGGKLVGWRRRSGIGIPQGREWSMVRPALAQTFRMCS